MNKEHLPWLIQEATAIYAKNPVLGGTDSRLDCALSLVFDWEAEKDRLGEMPKWYLMRETRWMVNRLRQLASYDTYVQGVK